MTINLDINYLQCYDKEAKVWVAYIPVLRKFTQSMTQDGLALAVRALFHSLEVIAWEWPPLPVLTTGEESNGH